MQKASFIVLEKEKKRLSKTQGNIQNTKIITAISPLFATKQKKTNFSRFFLYRMISSKIFVPISRIFLAAM